MYQHEYKMCSLPFVREKHKIGNIFFVMWEGISSLQFFSVFFKLRNVFEIIGQIPENYCCLYGIAVLDKRSCTGMLTSLPSMPSCLLYHSLFTSFTRYSPINQWCSANDVWHSQLFFQIQTCLQSWIATVQPSSLIFFTDTDVLWSMSRISRSYCDFFTQESHSNSIVYNQWYPQYSIMYTMGIHVITLLYIGFPTRYYKHTVYIFVTMMLHQSHISVIFHHSDTFTVRKSRCFSKLFEIIS